MTESNETSILHTTDYDQNLFKAIAQHLLHDENPAVFLRQALYEGLFQKEPFYIFKRLEQTEQSPVYHPEGNVWNHTLLVVYEAAKRRSEQVDPAAFMWAALLHDLGKPDTTKIRKGKITSYNHEQVGAELAENFLSCFIDDASFIAHVTGLIRFHMMMLFVLKDSRFSTFKEMLEETDYKELGALCLCDRLGRTGANQAVEEENLRMFLRRVEEKMR